MQILRSLSSLPKKIRFYSFNCNANCLHAARPRPINIHWTFNLNPNLESANSIGLVTVPQSFADLLWAKIGA